MKYIFLLLLLAACAAPKTPETSGNASYGTMPSICPDLSGTLLVAAEGVPCANQNDTKTAYSLIAVYQGDTTLHGENYRQNLTALLLTARMKSSRVIYFSSPVNKATVEQMAIAMEVLGDLRINRGININSYDVYSVSIAYPGNELGFIVNTMGSLK